ncbi:MAG: glycosyltransferase family 2 protein [Lachnospiraceae bacterium]|nr:glycosyltransferase family 2 protein [Lachnospiraceae bacterium]
MKLLTVTIPCYNSAAYMRNCIESLLPGGEEVEILIVDDGSVKDNTAEIADEYQEKYPTIVKAIHQPNKGHGGAVNTGIANAEGLYFKVVDSDDWVDQEAYQAVLDTLRSFTKEPELPDLLLSNYVYEKEGAKHKKVMRYPEMFPKNKVFGWNELKRIPASKYVLMHSMIVRTQLLRDVNLELPEHTFYVDNLFAFVPFSMIQTMYYLDVDLYRYYIGRPDQSVHESVMISRIEQQLKVNRLMIRYMHSCRNLKGKQRRYMIHYLSIIMAVSSAMLIRSGKPEALEQKAKLWEMLKKSDIRAYRICRYSATGIAVNLHGKGGRMTFQGLYKIAQKLFGFN